jgi:hypothetical protein
MYVHCVAGTCLTSFSVNPYHYPVPVMTVIRRLHQKPSGREVGFRRKLGETIRIGGLFGESRNNVIMLPDMGEA